MSSVDLEEITLSGTRYEDVNGRRDGGPRPVFVFEGLAYMYDPEREYYHSLSPDAVQQIKADCEGGTPVEKTLVTTGTRVYVEDSDPPITVGIVDYGIDGMYYRYDGKLSGLHEFEDGQVTTSKDCYVKLSSPVGTDGDVIMKEVELKDAIRQGEVRQLWPVWQSGNR